jgi:hypothetical protein
MIKQLEGTYKIGNENLDNVVIINNPSYYINKIIDNIINKRCDVDVIFRDVENGLQYSEILKNYTYNITWEDQDIFNWVEVKLGEYLI